MALGRQVGETGQVGLSIYLADATSLLATGSSRPEFPTFQIIQAVAEERVLKRLGRVSVSRKLVQGLSARMHSIVHGL